jgi:sugar/nucleoside kinase (ribokinase family)
MAYKAMIAGHLCLDITPSFPTAYDVSCEDIFRPGKLTNVNDAVLSTGGAVSNTGIAMSKLGVDVILSSLIGDDCFGKIIKELIEDNAGASFKIVEDQSSSYTIVLAPPNVDRIVFHNPGTNDTFTSDDIDYNAVDTCDLFHFGYPPLMKSLYKENGAELVKLFKKIKDMGLTTSLDMALPDPSSQAGRADWKTILKNLLPYVDIFVPSIEEIAFMLDRSLFEQRTKDADGNDPVLFYKPDDYAMISSALLGMGAEIIMIKSGIKGTYLRTAGSENLKQIGKVKLCDINDWAERELWAPSFKAENFASALGAGDATIAGFLSGLMKGFSPEESLKIANITGWQNVQHIDAHSGIKDWETTLQLLKETERPVNPTYLDAENWTCQKQGVYIGPNDRKR